MRHNNWMYHFMKVLIFVGCLCVPGEGLGDVQYIDLTNPFLRKIPMAVPVFSPVSPGGANGALNAGLADSLSRMLDFTGYFKILDRGSFLHDPKSGNITQNKINFQNWTTVGAELLITGGVNVQADELVLELRLFDTFKASLVVGKRYRGRVQDQRDMIRRFCAEVIQALTGNQGVFDSQIAFVSNGTGQKEIYVCEFDGHDVRQVTKNRSITSFPAWSSDGRYLAFTSFAKGPAKIHVRDLKSDLETIFNFSGGQIAPAWLGVFLPLIAVNCAILGTSLFMVERNYDFMESIVFGTGSGVGWMLAIVTMAAIRKKLRYASIPDGLDGMGISMIVTGLMAMAFMLFSGITLT